MYLPATNSYVSEIGSVSTGWSVRTTIAVEAGKLYTDAYFVTEKQARPSQASWLIYVNVCVCFCMCEAKFCMGVCVRACVNFV